MYVCMCMCICISTCLCVCVCVCVCLCVYMFTHTHTHTHTGRGERADERVRHLSRRPRCASTSLSSTISGVRKKIRIKNDLEDRAAHPRLCPHPYQVCVCVCVCVVYLCVYVCVCGCIHARPRLSPHSYQVRLCVCVYIHTHTHNCVCLCVCVCMIVSSSSRTSDVGARMEQLHQIPHRTRPPWPAVWRRRALAPATNRFPSYPHQRATDYARRRQ